MTGSGTALDPYVIWDVNDLQDVGNGAPYLLSDYYELGQNIDASATVGWNAGQGFAPIGEGTRITNIAPSGDHSSGGAWVINPADGILWDKVDEDPNDGDATYIQATADDTWALFNPAPIAQPLTGSIDNVTIRITRKQIGVGTSALQAYLRIGGINYLIGSPESSTGSYSTRSWIAYTNPATGLAWTPAEVNAIEAFGVYVSDASPNVRITAIVLRVRHLLRFSGNFNGGDHAISNLFMDRVDSVALFEETEGANIQDIRLTDVNITGAYDVAAFIGWDRGNTTISNCHSSGAITGLADAYDVAGIIGDTSATTIISNCHSSCVITVSGGDIYDVGGIAGVNAGTISNSSFTGTITLVGDDIYDVGGIAGDNDGSLEKCLSTGNISVTCNHPEISLVGGLAGDNRGAIDQSFSTGDVIVEVIANGAGSGVRNIGGLCGDNSGPISDSYSMSSVIVTNTFGGAFNERIGGLCGDSSLAGTVIENCYFAGRVTTSPAFTDVGGLLGDNSAIVTNSFWDTEKSGVATSAGGEGKTTEQMKSWATFLDAGWDMLTHSVHDPSGGYPFLSWQIPGSSPIWYIYYVAPGPPPIPSVLTLPATEVR